MEPATIGGALAAINQLIVITKGITGIIKDTGKAEAMEKLIELNAAILELQEKHAEMFSENQSLKEAVQRLKEQQILRTELRFQHGVYFRTGSSGDFFCGVCLDRDEKFVRVAPFDNHNGRFWICKACKNEHHAPR